MGRVADIENMPPDEKGRSTDLPISDGALRAGTADDCFFDAVMAPNRSLPNSGFFMVMAVVVSVYLAGSVFFLSLGAWPVICFFGLDILLVWGAFKLSYRQGRLRERVFLTQDTLIVSRVLPSGHITRWRLQPFWTQIHMDRPIRHESQVRLVSKGRSLILGSFLSPAEREEFGEALGAALQRSRLAV